jgi:tryptophan-rich sensory protein
MPSIPAWYAALKKPVFNPPNWIFGPVWTTLFVMMGISLFLVWDMGSKKDVKWAMTIFGIQLLLNVLWSIVFFGMRAPLGAFGVIIVLWASILATIISFSRVSNLATLLLVPYILWVSFAAVLNFAVVLLNR